MLLVLPKFVFVPRAVALFIVTLVELCCLTILCSTVPNLRITVVLHGANSLIALVDSGSAFFDFLPVERGRFCLLSYVYRHFRDDYGILSILVVHQPCSFVQNVESFDVSLPNKRFL